MSLPFTAQQFFDVFGAYNQAVWPIQVVFYAAAIVVIVLIFKGHRLAGRVTTLVLAFLWAWMGIVYHILFFSRANPAAPVFGVLFVIQALLFIRAWLLKDRVRFAFRRSWSTGASIFLAIYALALYQPINMLAGHAYPQTPTFGLPCPTTIFTFALFLLATTRVPFYLVIIPVLWAAIGSVAALKLDAAADWMLLVAAIVCVSMLVARNAQSAIKAD